MKDKFMKAALKEAQKAQTAAKALFGGGADNSNMPTFELSKEPCKDALKDVFNSVIE